jgi:hypothetical protein
MREPLSVFADRLVRNGEITEFIRGLIVEKGVSAETITEVACDADMERQGGSYRERNPMPKGGFRDPLPGADPHDPDGGHDPMEGGDH